MGLSHVGNVKGAEYMQIYKLTSTSSLNPKIVMIVARVTSLLIYPYSLAIKIARKLKKIAKKLITAV